VMALDPLPLPPCRGRRARRPQMRRRPRSRRDAGRAAARCGSWRSPRASPPSSRSIDTAAVTTHDVARPRVQHGRVHHESASAGSTGATPRGGHRRGEHLGEICRRRGSVTPTQRNRQGTPGTPHAPTPTRAHSQSASCLLSRPHRGKTRTGRQGEGK
jgi:hypothetical protein